MDVYADPTCQVTNYPRKALQRAYAAIPVSIQRFGLFRVVGMFDA